MRKLNVYANFATAHNWFIIRHLPEHYIEAKIINFNGRLFNKTVFLPKIDSDLGNSTLNTVYAEILWKKKYSVKN